jgi:hypothetical protein
MQFQDKRTMASQWCLNLGLYFLLPGYYPAWAETTAPLHERALTVRPPISISISFFISFGIGIGIGIAIAAPARQLPARPPSRSALPLIDVVTRQRG